MQSIIGNYETFLKSELDALNAVGIDIHGRFIDHIAFRCISSDDYIATQAALIPWAEKRIERSFNKRDVSIYKFYDPLQYEQYVIPYLELISYREGDTFARGLEHIEVVIDAPLSLLTQYPALDWRVAEGRLIHIEVFLQFEKYAVKFHNLPLEEAVQKQIETGLQ